MPKIRHFKNLEHAHRTRVSGQNGGYSSVSAADAGRACVGSDHCPHPIVPDAPVRLCGAHIREVYAFASDLLGSNWDSAVRDYVSELHGTFKPPRATLQPRQGLIYFIRFGDRVKIGYTTDPKRRLRALPHEQVIGIVPGTRQDEAAWHKLLADFHVVGEWFPR